MCMLGYGLTLEEEMKLLRVLHRARALARIDLVVTYLGAHSVPAGSTAGTRYTTRIHVSVCMYGMLNVECVVLWFVEVHVLMC